MLAATVSPALSGCGGSNEGVAQTPTAPAPPPGNRPGLCAINRLGCV